MDTHSHCCGLVSTFVADWRGLARNSRHTPLWGNEQLNTPSLFMSLLDPVHSSPHPHSSANGMSIPCLTKSAYMFSSLGRKEARKKALGKASSDMKKTGKDEEAFQVPDYSLPEESRTPNIHTRQVSWQFRRMRMRMRARARVCVCVCVRARTRTRACMCM